jgi:hypothetical protein
MNNVARLSREDRRELWSRAAERLSPLPDLMIEKDFWVCFTLQHLFALPGARDHFIFKGGTSLSKVWRAIHRFSEDIDISLSREWLGFGGDRDPEAAGTRKQRAKQLAALSEACSERLREEIAPALNEALAQVLGRTSWNLEIDPEDEQTLLFTYPTALGEITGRAYIRPVVRIECGARSDRWPVSSGHVTPYVAEAFPDTLPNAGVDIPVLDIERTFWEKASILHAEAHRPADKPVPERYSRHYSDVADLAKSGSAARALERDDLRARVVAHKQVFFPAAWAEIETAVPGTFRLLPQRERAAELARDYASMREMFFREPMSWAEILEVLGELEKRINSPSRSI